jgi:hypothetical protein
VEKRPEGLAVGVLPKRIPVAGFDIFGYPAAIKGVMPFIPVKNIGGKDPEKEDRSADQNGHSKNEQETLDVAVFHKRRDYTIFLSFFEFLIYVRILPCNAAIHRTSNRI